MKITINYNFNGTMFAYDVLVSEEDFCDYLLPKSIITTYSMTDKEIVAYREGIKKVLKNFDLDADKLEENDYFVEFLKTRYEEIARQEFEENV